MGVMSGGKMESELCDFSENELRLMSNAVRELYRNYNDTFKKSDYLSIGHGNVLFEEHLNSTKLSSLFLPKSCYATLSKQQLGW